MEIWAHRGAYQGFRETENTLPAFRKAVEHERVDGIELDVRLCGSGEPIVFHDPTLWRMSQAFVLVESATLAELRERSGIYIPTLKEALAEFKGKTKFILNLKPNKTRSMELERKVAKLIQDFPVTDVKISSDSVATLAKIFALTRGRVPELCLVLESRLSAMNFAPNLLHMNAVHVHEKFMGWSVLGTSKLRKWKSKGLKVRVWTVNDGGKAQKCAIQGADGIITDNVQRIYRRPT